jgi:hypothetical protein
LDPTTAAKEALRDQGRSTIVRTAADRMLDGHTKTRFGGFFYGFENGSGASAVGAQQILGRWNNLVGANSFAKAVSQTKQIYWIYRPIRE